MAPPAAVEIVRTTDHRYFAGEQELLGVTAILDATGIGDFSGPWFDDFAKDRGAAVAQAIALDVENDLDEATLDPQLVPYLAAWRLFCAETTFVVEHCERIVGDLTLGVAGTLDLILRDMSAPHDLRRLLVDVKLGFYPSVAIQTAAYARMARTLYERPVIFDRAALVLSPHAYKLEPLPDRQDEHTFLAAVRVAHWQRAHAKKDRHDVID